MVKNTKGGSRHKKMARKNIESETVRHKTRLADPEEPCEMYAVVTNLFGQGNCEVMCNDGVARLCVIRRKFKGRNRRNNQVMRDTKVLVGLRDWEIVSENRKQKCDLLEVYETYQYNDLKDDPRCNWNILKTASDDKKVVDDDFDFDYGKEDKSSPSGSGSDGDDSDESGEINIDDI